MVIVAMEYTLMIKKPEKPPLQVAQSPSFRIFMDYTQNQTGCNVQISLLSRCQKPLNNST